MTPGLDASLVTYWLAAAKAGYAAPADWITWADQHLLAMPAPPKWLIDLSLASDVGALASVAHEHSGAVVDDPSRFDDAVLGFLSMRVSKGELDFSSFLREAGTFADSSSASVDSDTFYAMLTRYETAITAGDREAIQDDALRRVSRQQQIASDQWDTIKRASGAESRLNL